jgi:peptidyl-prolyl cis-trans isomerase SurA
MKKTLRFLLLAIALGVSMRAHCAEVVNGIAVLVNESIITHQDVQIRIAPALESARRQFIAQGPTPERLPAFEQRRSDIERDGLDQLISFQLVLSDYKTKGYNIPDGVINEEVERRIRERFRGNRVDFIKTIKAEGTTFEAFRTRIREDFIYRAMLYRNVGQDLIISPAKIEKYYQENQEKYKVDDQVKLRTIVLNRTRTDDTDTTRKRVEEILTKLKEGANFAEMAQVYSEGSQRAQGGDWGWVEKSVPAREIADVAFSLQPGQHSGVVESPSAYYIILVEGKRPAHHKPISEVRDEIERNLLNQEQARLEKAWLERLKSKAFIRYFPN